MAADGKSAADAAKQPASATLTAAIAAARDAGGELPGETAFRNAAACFAAGRTDEAIEEASSALEIDSADEGTLVLKLRVLVSIAPSRLEEAQPIATALLARWPGLHEAHALAAAVAQSGGNEQVARAEAQAAIALEPSDELAQALVLSAAGISVAEEAPVPPELAPLAERLRSADPKERVAAAIALAKKKPDGPPIVVGQLARESEPATLAALAGVLGEAEERRAVPVLARLLKTLPPAEADARLAIVRALGRIGDPKALPDVIASGVKLDDPGVRGSIVQLYSRFDDGGRYRVQRDLLDSPDPAGRTLAVAMAQDLLHRRLAETPPRHFKESLTAWAKIGLIAVLLVLVFLRARIGLKPRFGPPEGERVVDPDKLPWEQGQA
jgi:tetratricopeptide (TPR) repeat protein